MTTPDTTALRDDLSLPGCPVVRQHVLVIMKWWSGVEISEDEEALFSSQGSDADREMAVAYIAYLESLLALMFQDEQGESYAAGYDAGVRRAVEVLRPFAAFAEGIKGGKNWTPPNDLPLVGDVSSPRAGAQLTLGDCRRARALLAELEGGRPVERENKE